MARSAPVKKMKSPRSTTKASVLVTVAAWAAVAACDSSGKTLGISNDRAASGGSPANSACTGLPSVRATPLSGASFQTCSGAIAAARFTNALCTCNNASVDGFLKTRGFDSERDPNGVNNGGAAVAINNAYTNLALSAVGYTEVFGSLAIAGAAPSTYTGYIKVAGDLRTAGAVTEFGYINVARDTWNAGDLACVGYTTVGRDAHYAAGFPLFATVGGKMLNESVRVDPMCPCGPGDILDVAAMVADGKAHNDSQANLDSGAFNAVVGTVHVTLPCGRVYVDRISVVGELVLDVTGPTALFVGGSIDTVGALLVNLAPQATIDIFVNDTLRLAGRASFGDEKRPAASRIYVGGDQDIILTAYETFVGNLYAPKARVAAPGYVSVLGALVARDFDVPGYAQFDYDRAITRAGDACPAPSPSADTCTKCSCTGGSACVDGRCKACTKDSDCCSQLGCNTGTGKCEPIQIVF